MVESNDKDQKTEEPTGKKISDARQQGNLAVSREMSSWFMFIAILVMLLWFFPMLGRAMTQTMRVFLEKPEQISLEDGGLSNALFGVVAGAGLPTTLVLGLFLLVAVLGTMIQTDFYMGTGKLKMEFSKLLPHNGFKRLFSLNSVTELLKSTVKMIVLGYMAYRVMLPVLDDLPTFVQMDLDGMTSYLHGKALRLLIMLMLIITVIAVADILYVRWSYFKSLRMTKQEVKDEHKQMEGDPMVRGRLRQIRLEKARRRMMANVPNASVIVTNPTHYAIALEYDGLKMMAPVVTAKGVDNVAMRIRAVAEENDIPIVSNPPLARTLYDTVELDDPIEPEQYRAVAEVISYVFKLKNKVKT
ncbi:MAG: flagellar biosynthesis protein FlhB [Proteobacteria bacterium]|jgi:flagellar biosynthetic protein FlhB|nr:flagellar biosynthesis protein FlhB [Alphaproteobacteria bacterium]NCC03768.1 flagellar biosynthesis protein FlhB [Pseudomonadota bacterium]